MGMFSSQVKFDGKHARIMQKYCKVSGGEDSVPIQIKDLEGKEIPFTPFGTRINLYKIAAMIGIIEGRKAEIDRSKNPETDKESSSSIFPDALNNNREDLMRIYRFMVLIENQELDIDTRVKKAFSMVPEERCVDEQKHFENYVRGGLEIIDERFRECKDYEDVCNAIIDLEDICGVLNDNA